jgi:sarcosine oxidase subunit beta
MNTTADVIIIGGGVNGCSMAYHFARRGSKVFLAERDFLASGATGKCAGGIRQQFGTEVNTRLCMYSVKKYETLAQELDRPFAFHQVGYLFVATTPEEMADFHELHEMWQRVGLKEARLINIDDIKAIEPHIFTDDLQGGSFCPTDGHADPNDATQAYAAAARRLGAVIEEKCEVTEILTDGDQVTGIRHNSGEVGAPVIVLAAGPHSILLAEKIGLELPIQPYRRMLVYTDPFPDLPATMPMIVDIHSGNYMRKEGEGVLTGRADPNDPPTWNESVDMDWLWEIVESAIHRVPILEKASIQNKWAGLYDTTPDHHPLLGLAPGWQNLWLACGFSGHGFMQAPAIGAVMSEMVLDGKATTVDVHALRPTRFAEGEPIEEKQVI